MTKEVEKINNESIEKAKQSFLSLPVSQAIKELSQTATKLIKDIDNISKYQDKLTQESLKAYQSQLLLCQEKARDGDFSLEERTKAFDLSMWITIKIEELKNKDNKRKTTEKVVKYSFLGITIAVAVPFVVKFIKDLGKWIESK